MRSVMKRICLSLAVIAVLIFTGCGQKKTKDPITVTLWHVYGGQTESPLNDLIDQFNETSKLLPASVSSISLLFPSTPSMVMLLPSEAVKVRVVLSAEVRTTMS